MATKSTKGKGKALLVINAATKAPIEVPLKAQEAIMQPVINLKKWIRRRMRTGGKGQMLPGGDITYYAYPKQTAGREMEITFDDTTGQINGGMFGAADASNLIGGIKSTYGTTLVKDKITLQSAKFLKHVFSKQDAKQEGLGVLVAAKLQDFTAEIEEQALVDLKAALVAAYGTTGQWATDAGYTAPTTGTGKRVQAKDYTASAADGLIAMADIVAVLKYRDRIGLKDGVETSYPFARGLNSAKSTIITISDVVNEGLLAAIQASTNGFVAGLGADTKNGLITSISYNGKRVAVEVIDDMPQKGGKDFNWSVEEVGTHGALALPNMWSAGATVRPHYEGLATQYDVLEATGLVAGLKFLQPELNFASFGA